MELHKQKKESNVWIKDYVPWFHIDEHNIVFNTNGSFQITFSLITLLKAFQKAIPYTLNYNVMWFINSSRQNSNLVYYLLSNPNGKNTLINKIFTNQKRI